MQAVPNGDIRLLSCLGSIHAGDCRPCDFEFGVSEQRFGLPLAVFALIKVRRSLSFTVGLQLSAEESLQFVSVQAGGHVSADSGP